jgi:Protein of unknown function (DUF3017)
MTPDTQQAPDGYRRGQVPRRDAGSGPRSAAVAAEAPRTGHRGDAARPAHAAPPPAHAAPPPPAEARRSAEDASIVGVIPLLAVLVVTVAGVYIAWRQGSAGGGEGGVIGGIALLAGAVARLLLPDRLAGLLATRKRSTDVITLALLGAGLLVAGLVLPR